MILYPGNGMAAHRDWASLTCRRRHNASISFWGSVRILGTSRKEESVLTPGVALLVSMGILGGGGGGEPGGGTIGPLVPGDDVDRRAFGSGIASCFLRFWILS